MLEKVKIQVKLIQVDEMLDTRAMSVMHILRVCVAS